MRDLGKLEQLVPLADDADFRARFRAAKEINKARLAEHILETVGVSVDPTSLFDVQIKRMHEYKRQVLKLLHAIALYNRIRRNPGASYQARTIIFAGKAAPGYAMAKLIIKLANDVARMVNNDPMVGGRLKVLFLPNYGVSLAERIIPAADLSEQISTAGTEASGTGNMKMALNGALTIGTLDGANVEIKQHVGDDNIFIFGLTAEEVEERRRVGIDEFAAIAASEHLGEVLDAIESGVFSPGERDRFKPLVNALRHHDYFLVTSDFDAYWNAQRAVDAKWNDRDAWWTSSAINTANMGWFSSDRTISEYAKDIWNVPVRAPRVP
jgi:starch phosphorylase